MRQETDFISSPDNFQFEELKDGALNLSVPTSEVPSRKKPVFRHEHTFSFEPSHMGEEDN